MKLVWFLGLLVFCYGVFLNGVGRTLPSRPAIVNIGAIFTLNSTIGRIAKIAIDLALEDVNSDSSILDGTKLKVQILDSNCSGFLGIVEGMNQKSLIFLEYAYSRNKQLQISTAVLICLVHFDVLPTASSLGIVEEWIFTIPLC